MSRLGADRDQAAREVRARQYLARDLRKLADPSLDADGTVFKVAAAVGVHPEDARALLGAISLRLGPERVRL